MTFTDDTPMPFGKYKGERVADVPASYMLWLWNQDCSNKDLAVWIKKSLVSLQKDAPDVIINKPKAEGGTRKLNIIKPTRGMEAPEGHRQRDAWGSNDDFDDQDMPF